MKTYDKVTLYYRGGFGFTKLEVKTVTVNVAPFAQYASAVHVTFREPRKKQDRGFVQSNKPSLIVVDGWGHPDVRDPLDLTADGHSKSRHSCFSEAYTTEFNEFFADYVKKSGAKVLEDFRTHNSYETAKPQCGKCAAIGTNVGGLREHAPGCANDTSEEKAS